MSLEGTLRMAAYEFTLVVEGFDIDDEAQLDALFEATDGDATPVARDGVVMLAFERPAASVEAAITAAVREVEGAVPGARVVRLDEDLVSTSDIATRVERSRESIRLLVEGARGPGGFPAPVGWVGDAIRVWRWADVVEWFAEALDEDHHDGATPIEAGSAALINAVLHNRGHDPAGYLGVHLLQRMRGVSLLHRSTQPVRAVASLGSSSYTIRRRPSTEVASEVIAAS